MKRFILSAGVVAIVLSGCATRADSIAPVSISATEYSTGCEETQTKLKALRERQTLLESKQNLTANTDAVGVGLIGIPIGSLFGGNVAGLLAQVKGEVLALQRHSDIVCTK